MFQARTLSFLNQRLFVVFFLGFSSGLPLLLTGSTLQAWFASAGISIKNIGFLSVLGLPYLCKFLWAPLMDRYIPPCLGRRRGWMLLMQIAVMIGLLGMARFHPQTDAMLMGVLALAIAFVSASQDVAINAYQTELLTPEERGLGAAMTVFGYRVAMLVASGIALIIAGAMGWAISYFVMAALMGVGLLTTFFAPDSDAESHTPPRTLRDAVVKPFKVFLNKHPHAIKILLAILLYKMGDDFVQSLNTTFLLRDLHFSLIDVGSIYKIVGFAATIVGLFIGGFFLKKLGLYRALLIFAFVQAFASILFVILALIGKNYTMMIVAVAGEYGSAGLGTSALLAWLMSLCDQRYTATQFALLSALASVGRVMAGPVSGYLVHFLGWPLFYAWGVLAALPGIFLLIYLQKRIVW